MFNVTIIKLKDVFKIVIVLIIIYVLSKFIFKNISIRNYLNQTISFNISDFIRFSINTESNIIKNISNHELQNETEKDSRNSSLEEVNSILHIASSIFEAQELEQDLGQEEKDNIGESKNQAELNETNKTNENTEVTKTQVVTQNPIAESYNREYNGIKIKNETSYELTDNMLNPGDLNINTENVLIFHTHTCESYTQSENYKYTPSRKLSYNRFKLLCI